MSKKTPSQEKLAQATNHASGEVEYGIYMEYYIGPYEDYNMPAVTREEDWQSVIYPFQSLKHAVERAEYYEADWADLRNIHVVQRTVSPWEVKR